MKNILIIIPAIAGLLLPLNAKEGSDLTKFATGATLAHAKVSLTTAPPPSALTTPPLLSSSSLPSSETDASSIYDYSESDIDPLSTLLGMGVPTTGASSGGKGPALSYAPSLPSSETGASSIYDYSAGIDPLSTLLGMGVSTTGTSAGGSVERKA